MNQINNLELEKWINTLLQSHKFKDYAPNGLQVQGKNKIQSIITGVTASKALIEKAIANKADAILVHHGWFWKNESPTITSIKHERIKLLLANDINLYGYHLPLDAHPLLGNNAQLAKVLEINPTLDDQGNPITHDASDLMWIGEIPATSLDDFSKKIQKKLNRKPLAVGNKQQQISKVAWCTGGAQSMMQTAIDIGVDVFITGEASEQNFHQAQESQVAFIAAGHHATERYGVQALGKEISKQLGLNVEFIDIDNPI